MTIAKINCKQFRVLFQPKKMGYNARYCSDKCKRHSQRARLIKSNPKQLTSARKRSYAATKRHPERIKKHRSSSAKYRNETREWLSGYKTGIGCVDCGYNKHPAALQLDHEGKKSIDIADARSSIKRLQEEIKNGECKVRCANCHSIKTWERKQKNDKIKA